MNSKFRNINLYINNGLMKKRSMNDETEYNKKYVIQTAALTVQITYHSQCNKVHTKKDINLLL